MADRTRIFHENDGDGAFADDLIASAPCFVLRSGNFCYAILGLVACHPEGVHGYRLKHDLESICDDLPRLSFGRIYGALDWLAMSGHLERSDCVQIGRPNRKVYRISADGERCLEDWLRLPILQNPHPFRDELSLKILFARHASAEALRSQIERQRGFVLTRLARMTRHRKRLAKTQLGAMAIDVVLAGPEMRMQADLAWLRQIESKLVAVSADSGP